MVGVEKKEQGSEVHVLLPLVRDDCVASQSSWPRPPEKRLLFPTALSPGLCVGCPESFKERLFLHIAPCLVYICKSSVIVVQFNRIFFSVGKK